MEENQIRYNLILERDKYVGGSLFNQFKADMCNR